MSAESAAVRPLPKDASSPAAVRGRSRAPWLAVLGRRLQLLPREEPLGPVDYTPPLMVFVAAVCVVAVVVAALTVRVTGDTDWTTLALGSVTIGFISAYSVRSLTAVNTSFSTSILVHVGLTVTVGPIGAAAGAIADSIGNNSRLHPGWFRTLFNTADYFLANIAAWAVYVRIVSLSNDPLMGVVAGLAAGLTQFVVNHIPLGGVLWLATRGEMRLGTFLRRSLSTAPYFLGYGLAADGFVLLHRYQQSVGFMLMIVQVVLLQGFLIFLARRMHAYDLEMKLHQEARVRLLERAIDASNQERERIAANIHDGVVQELAGLSFSLGAYAGSSAASLSDREKGDILKLVREASETARRATRDLRTLIIEIAPPKLKEQGLRPALEDLLANVGSGSRTGLEMEEGLHLSDSINGLVYRVAQEAVRNCMKYAHADSITIKVRREGANVLLLVIDDGRGFDTAEQARRMTEGHVGLGLLKRTVEDGSGSLHIESAPGRGTAVEMRAPIVRTGDAGDQGRATA